MVGSGAVSDLRHATNLATGWVCRQGLGSKSQFALSVLSGNPHTEYMIRTDEDNDEVRQLLNESRDRILSTITIHQRFVLAIARRLLETSEIRSEEMLELAEESDLKVPERASIVKRFSERLDEYNMGRPK